MNTRILKQAFIPLFAIFSTFPSNGQYTNNNHRSFRSSFVTISKSNPQYFELSNRQFYIPIGANLCWAKSPEVMESYFKQLSENGGNYARIWLNYPSHEVEKEYGKVDYVNLSNVDKILGFADK